MSGFDPYDLRARLAPAYLVFAPAVVFVVVVALGSAEWWSRLGGVLAACGAPILAAQWGRSGGRGKQDVLFASWGGPPTTTLLRHRTGGHPTEVAERHRTVKRTTGMSLPSAAEEEGNPATADARYGEAVRTLRAKTQDPEEFPLLFKENAGYGFRRNLWGRKRYGIAVAVLVILAGAGLLLADAFGGELVSPTGAIVAAAFGVVALAVWLAVVTTDWVRESANAYASQLFQSAIRLPDAG